MLLSTFLQNIEVVFMASMLSIICVCVSGFLFTLFVLAAIKLDRLLLINVHWTFTRLSMSLFCLVVASGVANCIYSHYYLKPRTPRTFFFFGENVADPQRGSNSSLSPPSRSSTPSILMELEPADRSASSEPETCASDCESESESSGNVAEVEAEMIERIPVAQVVRPRMMALNVAIAPSQQFEQ